MKIEKSTWYWVIGGLAAATAVLWVGAFVIKKKNDVKEIDEYTEESKVSNVSATSNDNFPLKKGSKGAKVKALQVHLNKKLKSKAATMGTNVDKYILDEDGIAGDLTIGVLKFIYGMNAVTEYFYNTNVK